MCIVSEPNGNNEMNYMRKITMLLCAFDPSVKCDKAKSIVKL